MPGRPHVQGSLSRSHPAFHASISINIDINNRYLNCIFKGSAVTDGHGDMRMQKFQHGTQFRVHVQVPVLGASLAVASIPSNWGDKYSGHG